MIIQRSLSCVAVPYNSVENPENKRFFMTCYHKNGYKLAHGLWWVRKKGLNPEV
jgi:hypothetical protein